MDFNTLNHDIRDIVLYAETTQILWNELNSRYGQANGTKIYQLKKNLCQITQGSSDIAAYFAKMKSNSDVYDMIRSNILMMQPLPSINRAYGILMQDKKQKEIHTTTDFTASSASINASSGGPVSGGTGENRTLVCTHYKRNGHSVNKCYKLIGFPKDFKFTKGKKFANLAEEQGKSDQNQSGQQ
ncbi:uncharacterized protein LOC143598896, partial [Bidens hawaiensis]|uniref:uncharacterized protein LOC143598896 n=1 Tax=Bidens hawaiensis TaxID=980011 RepID=UPI004049A3E7